MKATPYYPAKRWDGSSYTRASEDNLGDLIRTPDGYDWNQIVAEVRALEGPALPVLSQAVWLNQQDATASDTPGGLSLVCGATEATGIFALTFPYNGGITLNLQSHGPNPVFGVLLTDSTKILALAFLYVTGVLTMRLLKGDDPAALVNQEVDVAFSTPAPHWVRFDGFDVSVSSDGYTWVPVISLPDDYLVADSYGIFVGPSSAVSLIGAIN